MGNKQHEFSFKHFFTSLTTKKAIWILIIVGAIVYCNALFNTFVWDDKNFIISNPEVHQFNLIALFGPNAFNSGPYYRPIPAVYFAALYSLFGNQAFFYHLFQITLHIISTTMLYLLLISLFESMGKDEEEKREKEWESLSGSQKIKLQRKYGFIGKIPYVKEQKTNLIALFLSLIFLVHPINVESVAYIGSTQSELYFLPGILALYLARKKHISGKRFLMINGLLFLCVLTKETGFLFIPLIILYRYLYTLNLKKIVSFVLSAAVITGIYLGMRFFIGGVFFRYIKQYTPIASLSLEQRLLNIPAIFIYYLKTFVFPAQLAIWQNWLVKSVSDTNFSVPLIVSITLLLLLSYAAFILYKRNRSQFRKFLFYFFWYLLGIGLLLQIAPLDMTVSDRWFYFPMVGLLGMGEVGLESIVKNETVKKPWGQRKRGIVYDRMRECLPSR